MVKLVQQIGARQYYISYSSDGHVAIEDLKSALCAIGNCTIHSLGDIGKYRPNEMASKNSSIVEEFLIDFKLSDVEAAVPRQRLMEAFS